MNCPSCNKDASKTINQFGLVKTCPSCNAKFKIKLQYKAILIYALPVGIVSGLLSIFIKNEYLSLFVMFCLLPLTAKHIYKLEKLT